MAQYQVLLVEALNCSVQHIRLQTNARMQPDTHAFSIALRVRRARLSEIDPSQLAPAEKPRTEGAAQLDSVCRHRPNAAEYLITAQQPKLVLVRIAFGVA